MLDFIYISVKLQKIIDLLSNTEVENKPKYQSVNEEVNHAAQIIKKTNDIDEWIK